MNDKPVKDYGSIRVPQSLVEDLKAWRQAFIKGTIYLFTPIIS